MRLASFRVRPLQAHCLSSLWPTNEFREFLLDVMLMRKVAQNMLDKDKIWQLPNFSRLLSDLVYMPMNLVYLSMQNRRVCILTGNFYVELYTFADSPAPDIIQIIASSHWGRFASLNRLILNSQIRSGQKSV